MRPPCRDRGAGIQPPVRPPAAPQNQLRIHRRASRDTRMPASGVSARRQRPERIAMVALAAGDEALALWLTAFDKILPRQFDAGLDRFRSAADQISVGEAAGFFAD